MNDNLKKKKVCFAASSGGHFEQLMKLKPLMEQYDTTVFTEKTKYLTSNTGFKMKYMKQVNRKELLFPIKMIINCFKSFFFVLKNRPDVIICTGVLAMIPLCVIGKWFGAKLIYIESFAKITSPTQSGKFLYKRADRFYVQWEEMKKFYPEAIYIGGIY